MRRSICFISFIHLISFLYLSLILQVLLDDGAIELLVLSCDAEEGIVTCEATQCVDKLSNKHVVLRVVTLPMHLSS